MRARRFRIAEEWNSYSQTVLPKDCSEIQKVETRRAFYCGAIALYSLVMRDISAGGDVNPEDLEMMNDLQFEMMKYADDLKAGQL